MRKITLIALLFALIWQANAQISESFENPILKKHELKLDLPYLLLGAFKVEYEYLLNSRSSIGAVGILNPSFVLKDDNPLVKTQFLGFYRWYFLEKFVASGLFLEGNLGVTSGYWNDRHDSHKLGKYTSFGCGGALGWKHVNKRGITLDIFGGFGVLLTDEASPGFYPRVGICLGKRF